MQRKRRMLTASRLCLLGIAVLASSFSVFAQCPNDGNCNALVGSIYASAVTGNSDGDIGVIGQTNSATAYGVWGANSGGGPGVLGSTASDTSSGVWGTNGLSGPGVRGTAFGSGLAGLFEGTVNITGDLTVVGVKNAVVETATFGKRKLYALESPENWFEDFGHAKLVNGRAVITIEPVFAETVNTEGDYHVFVTPKGNCSGLYVSNQGPG